MTDKQELENLQHQLEKKDKIIHVLKDRVKKNIPKSGDAYAIFERNIVLQGLVLEQTKNLQESALKAEAGSKAKSDFLAQMSHEIRTPLNVITGMTHLLQRTGLNNKQQAYATNIKESSQALLAIINDILDVSKIEAGKMRLEHIEFSIQPIIDHLASIFGVGIENKDLEVDYYLDATIPDTLVGDPLRLQQILNNLCSNALKFTEQGKVTVQVKVTEQTKDFVTLQFSVKDTGIGINKEQAEHLFQPFSQADDYITRKFGGTGLGLSICRHLVEMMGGKIWLKTKLDQGTTFFMTLSFPLRLDEDIEDKLIQSPSLKPLVDVGENFVVLVVDDNVLNMQIISELLEDLNLTVLQASSGQQAIDILREGEVDLILMDIQMPDMDGLATTRKIRSMQKYEMVPIFAMTAHAMEQDEQKSLDAGMNAHLTKPIDPEILAEMLAGTLVKEN